MTHTSRPRLLDLFCGAGGAAMGYSRAAYEAALAMDVGWMQTWDEIREAIAGVHRVDRPPAAPAHQGGRRVTLAQADQMTAEERSRLRAQVDARTRARLERRPRDGRMRQQWTDTTSCPVHKTPIPLKTDGTLGAYCPQCLGEAAMALERLGYVWRLKGYAEKAA